MINFTAGAANILAACKAAEIDDHRHLARLRREGEAREASSRRCGEKVTIVYLEDVRARVGLLDKLRGLFSSKKPLVARQPDDPAAILFTSGSEGTPKGVVLSHRNMLANAAQAAARIDFGRTDKVFNVLPVFHSFGLTVGLVLPLVVGRARLSLPLAAALPADPGAGLRLNATILFGTDTFLAGYARAAHPYDFRSLRYVLAGAEPVKEATRRTYMEKFGLRILEGYGVTETAPVLAINTPMFNRFGTVGRLMPGMEARLEPVPGVDDGGRLFVRGPNVMLGYLRAENPGVLEPPAEGWHDTGDIVAHRRARASSPSRAAPSASPRSAARWSRSPPSRRWPPSCGRTRSRRSRHVPDARKGERLVLVTEQSGATRAAFQAFAKSQRRLRADGPGRGRASSTRCRCSARASSTMWGSPSWCASV